MRTSQLVGAVLLSAAAWLAGCSTPQVALDEANHTTVLMASLDTQLKGFRRLEEASERQQRLTLIDQQATINRLLGLQTLETMSSHSSGDTYLSEVTTKLLGDADQLAANRKTSAAFDATYGQTLATLMTPLPDTSRTLTAAQAAMAPMGVELSRETRAKELIAFGKDVKNNIVANKAKLAAAVAAAASAATAASAAAATAPDGL